MATVTSSKRHLLVTSDTYTSNGDVTVGGDLYVNGSQTTINTATLSVEDKNITLNYGGTASSSQGAGITITGSNATLLWDHANTKWTLSNGLSVNGNISASNLSGTNTGDQDLSGYALTSHNHDGRYIRLDVSTTPTNKVTFGYGVSDLNNVGGGHGVTGFRSTFQASNRPGSGNYATGVEFTYHDTGARTQFVAASSGQNTTPELWVRGEAWGSTPSWGDWYQIYHENHKPTPAEIGAQPAGNYETDDGTDDRYVFKVDLGNLANVTRWYKVATVNIGNGGLLMRGSLTNHVESFGSTKFDLTIQGREANASDQIEINGSIDVFDDNTGVYIVKSAVSGSYTTYDVYIECYNYTQAWVELIKTGLTTFDTSGNYVTTAPSGLVELDTSNYNEGSYTIIDSENRFSIRKISANVTQISGNAPSSAVLRIGAGNNNQIYMDGSTVTINDDMETERIYINTCDTNTTSTTALVLNGTEVEKRTLGSRAFDSTSYLPLAGGTMSGAINMNGNSINMVNANLSNVNNITINDPGYQEGISWSGGSGWGIWESPDNMSNVGGSLQFSTGTTRQMTLDTSGVLETKSAQIVNNTTGSCVAHWSNSGSSTGAIKVTIPGTHSSNWSMLILRVAVYEYNGNEHTIFYVSGHDWTSGWYNNGVTKWGDSDKEISVAYDSNDDYIIIGDVSSTWSYGHVTVDVVAHPSFYHSAMDITSGWAISQVTSLSGITVQSVTNKLVADRAWVNAQGFLTSIPSHTHTWANIDNSKYASGSTNVISSASTGSPSSSATLIFDDSGGVNKVALSSLDLSLMDNSNSGFLTSITGQTDPKYLRSDANDTGSGVITLSQNNSTTPYPLILKNISNANGVGIEFDDNFNGAQRGYIKHFHSDTKSYGSGAAMIISSSEATTTILADGKLMYAEGIYSKPGSGTGAGTRKDSNWDTAYTHSQSAHAPVNAEQNVQANWNETSTSSDAFILNKPSIPAASGKGQNQNYVASSTSTSNRGNYGAGVWAYSGYSGGSNRPFTYDATLQVMPTSGLGFELSTGWHSSDEGKLKIRALRDCCEGWGTYHDVWTSANFSQTTIDEWNTASDNHITGIAVTGTSTKTITLTQNDGGTISANFTDSSGSAAETDTLATVTGRGASTTTSCTFNTITMNTPVVGSSNKIKFANNDFIRFDDANGVGRFHFDCDGSTNNASLQAATFVGALSGNASTASSAAKWTTARTLTLNGDVSGSVSWDGSGNATLTTVVANNSHQHSKLYEESTISYGGSYLQWTDLSGNGGTGQNGSTPGNPFSDWFHHLIMNHGNSNGYYVDIAACFHSDDVYFRRNVSGSLSSWREFIHSGNIGSQSVSNADTVDNLHATDFLRSNADDGVSAGVTYTWAATDTQGLVFENSSYNKKLYIGGWTTSNSAGISRIRNSNDNLHIDAGANGHLYLNHYCTGNVYIRGNTAWHAGNDGSGSGLDADKVDGFEATRFFRRVGKTSANVGPGWMTVAENTSNRQAGEIIVTDGDSGDHSYIRIEWMRSYADSHYTVLNTGGHSNRITGVRVLKDGDQTYGNKKLQVYVTVASTYEVNVYEQGDIDDFGSHTAVTPVIQSSILGYSTQGSIYENLDAYAFSVDQGVQGQNIRSAGNVDGTNFRDKDNTSYSLTPSSGSTGYWQVNTPSGYVQIGAQNTSYAHFQTDRARFYFNKEVQVDGGVLRSHNEDLQLGRAGTSDKIQIRSTNIGFFLDGAEDMRLENDGDLHVERDVIAYSSTISDERLKDNVLTIDGALDKVCKLRGVEYTWNKGSRKDTRDLGVIAQEVEQVIPEIVREKKMPLIDDSEETYKTVDYEKLTAVLIEAVKELKAEVADLKQQINEK